MTAINVPFQPMPNPKRIKIAFAIALILLAIAAVTRVWVVQTLKLSFQKLPVQPSAALITIPATLGPWMQATVDRAMNPDFEHELGTKEYIFREYVDTRVLNPVDRAKFVAATLEQREKMLSDGKMGIDSKGRIRFAITYYTGSSDTVPHVPERCFAADGWRPDNFTVPNWAILPRADSSLRGVDVRMMNFEDQIATRSFKSMQVCYFFQVNGTYEQDPIFGVRKRLQKLTESHAYFAKIELVTGLSEPKLAEPVMQDFLTHAMSDVERVLPDWNKVSAAPVKVNAAQGNIGH